MVWKADWDKHFIVGGNNRLRLTPNFRLNEFMDEQGNVRIHRELVVSLQLLRDRFRSSIKVVAIDPDGLGATIRAAAIDELFAEATRLKEASIFEAIIRGENDIFIRILDPDSTHEVDLEQVLMAAFSVTSAFETSGDPFQQITGNFDGAGISFGPSQWNFKSGTLIPLFEKFKQADEAALRSCFVDSDDYEEWLDVMKKTTADQIRWGNAISTGRSLANIMDPWEGYFQAVGRVPEFRSIMVEESLREYGARMLREIKYLQSLAPAIQIDHARCVCALYDLVIQQGSLSRAKAEIEARVAQEKPLNQFDLVRIAVEERGKKATQRFRADCISRRLGILKGIPIVVEEAGETSQRANIKFYMLRNIRVRNAKELMTADVTEQVVKASNALASDKTLIT